MEHNIFSVKYFDRIDGGSVCVMLCCSGKAEDSSQAKAKPNVQVQTKDDAYDTFMKEMAGLL